MRVVCKHGDQGDHWQGSRKSDAPSLPWAPRRERGAGGHFGGVQRALPALGWVEGRRHQAVCLPGFRIRRRDAPRPFPAFLKADLHP